MLQIIDKVDRLEKLLRDLENRITNFSQIFQIVSELNNKEKPDERIDDMIAELRGAWLLNNKGYTDIVYQKKDYDFSCQKKSTKYAVEVKFIRGPDFKRQEKTGSNLAYNLNSDAELNKLNEKINEAFFQLRKHYRKIVIIVTNNLELDKFWFGDDIENFRKQMGKQHQSKIFIVTNGDIYG